MKKKVFNGVMTENVKISSDEFYKLGGFSNPELFRTSQGHFKQVETLVYKQFKKVQKWKSANTHTGEYCSKMSAMVGMI